MIENKEISQLIKYTILNYLNKETVSDDKEMDWEEMIKEAEVSWENQVLTEFGLNELPENEKRGFLEEYQEQWKNSFLKEEIYFEPGINFNEEELENNILEIENQKIEINDFFIWLDSQEFNLVSSKEKSLKIKLNCSPTKFKNLLVRFFENKGVIVDDDKLNRITCFIANCFSWRSKYSFKNKGNETINFLDDKSLMHLISLFIFLSKNEKIEYKSTYFFTQLLIYDLKKINQERIGLNNNLRSKITKHLLNKTTIELCKLAGFKNSTEINYIISN